MWIDVFDDIDGLDDLRADWEAVYAADPEAQFFLSWTWVASALRGGNAKWRILAARPSESAARHVAFMPVRLRTGSGPDGPVEEVALGPMRLGDYQGLICLPAFEQTAIPALAARLDALPWGRLVLENLALSERRIELLTHRFRGAGYTLRSLRSVDRVNGTDNLVCPHVPLPSDWDAYLAGGPSANTRQKMRRFLKKVEAGELRVTHADAASLERDLRILMDFWSARWTGRKGEAAASITRTTASMLRRCFADGATLLPVLWQDERPLAAMGCLVDRTKKSVMFLMGGRDQEHAGPPPGFVLHAHTIRHAIAQGFTRYDLLRGNEPYKYAFGVQERRLKILAVSRAQQQDAPREAAATRPPAGAPAAPG